MEVFNLIFAFLTVVTLIILSISLIRLKNHYNKLIEVSGKENLKEILDTVLDRLVENSNSTIGLNKKLDLLEQSQRYHIQKLGLVRFNPFEDIGGSQSFVLSLLDNNNSGVILTSIHNRNSTRWYVRKVISGQGEGYELSEEEKKSIATAGHFQGKKI